MHHLELIYCDDQKEYDHIQELIKAKWPEASFEDGSDYIHEYRFEVQLPCTDEQFTIFALENKFAFNCFGFNLTIHEHPDKILAWVNAHSIEQILSSQPQPA